MPNIALETHHTPKKKQIEKQHTKFVAHNIVPWKPVNDARLNRWIKWKWTNEIRFVCVCMWVYVLRSKFHFFCWNVLPIFHSCRTRFNVGGLRKWRFWKKVEEFLKSWYNGLFFKMKAKHLQVALFEKKK